MARGVPGVSVAEHLERVLSLASPQVERGVALDLAAGRVLASAAAAALPVPPFDNSAMDGFAVRAADLPGEGPWTLPVAGDIPAGSPPLDCPPGNAVRVMTGAPVPPGEGIIVVPVEQTDIPAGPVPLPRLITIHRADPARSHVRPRGANLAEGAVAAAEGTVLDAGAMAALVSAGVRSVDVYDRPRVTVVSTGDELVPWPRVPGAAQLPDSNLPMLAGLAAANGAGEVHTTRAGDAPGSLAALLDDAAETSDVILTSGGISAGAFDVVRAAVEPTGRAWFGGVVQRPGGPQGAGRWNGTALLCLPGNPVAAWVSFHLYAAPLLRALRCGRPAAAPHLRARAGEGFRPPRSPSPQVVPVRLDFSGAYPVATPFSRSAHGSSDVASLTGVSGYVVLRRGPVPDSLPVYLTES